MMIEQAVPLGLILNELATNALKHAFRGRPEGELTVSLQSDCDGRACLSVKDNGVGLPAGFDWTKTQSLGLHLVRILTQQLKGTHDVKDGDGLEFLVCFAVRRG